MTNPEESTPSSSEDGSGGELDVSPFAPESENLHHVETIARALSLDGRWMDRLGRLLVIGLVLTVCVALITLLSSVVLPVFVAWLVAWVVNPLVERLEARKVPRWAGILLVGACSLGGVASVLLLLVPVFVSELLGALERAPEWLDGAYASVASLLEERAGIGTDKLDEVLDGVFEEVQELASALLGTLTSSAGALINVVLIPVFSFYFLLDFKGMHLRMLSALPPSVREVVRVRAVAMDDAVGRWLRGQLKVASALAVLLAIALWVVGLRMGFVIGLVSGLLNVFPFVGAMVGLTVSLLLALAGGGSIGYLLLVAGVFLGLQAFESYWLTPRWVGSSVGLGPVSVIVVILVGGALFGFLGVILAVPVTAAVAVLTRDILEIWKRMESEGDRA